MTPARCSFPIPAQRLNARVDLDLGAPGSRNRWRARCACGRFEVGGYETPVDAWLAIDRHRAADQAIAALELESTRGKR